MDDEQIELIKYEDMSSSDDIQESTRKLSRRRKSEDDTDAESMYNLYWTITHKNVVTLKSLGFLISLQVFKYSLILAQKDCLLAPIY